MSVNFRQFEPSHLLFFEAFLDDGQSFAFLGELFYRKRSAAKFLLNLLLLLLKFCYFLFETLKFTLFLIRLLASLFAYKLSLLLLFRGGVGLVGCFGLGLERLPFAELGVVAGEVLYIAVTTEYEQVTEIRRLERSCRYSSSTSSVCMSRSLVGSSSTRKFGLRISTVQR